MKGIVYKIYCRDSSITEFYVGSSVDFENRKYEHKYNCNNIKRKEYNSKVYRYIRENAGWDNWDFEILLETEVDSKEQLRLLYEREFQIDLKPELNVIQEGRTPKEYREDNKEKLKQYREDHKEKINQTHKKYYEDHKEKINQTRKEKYSCDCGSTIRKSDKTKHQKSKKHQEFILSLSA